ncbi:MAG: DUF4351 domain-containing protein [Magnetococcales bacterium]|nr:DUF4351 domain-containing protein [Magnetococcales bacterium]
MKQLFRELLLAGLDRLDVDPLPAIPDDLQEVVIMLAARVEKWAQDYKQQGLQEGKAEILLQLLQERFGLVPEAVRKKVTSANPDDINAWARKIFRADSLQALFQ